MQHECIPQAILGMDVLCQAKSGMGKTAVFVIAILQQITVKDENPEVQAVVLCHTRELAYQVCARWRRLAAAGGGSGGVLLRAARQRPCLLLPLSQPTPLPDTQHTTTHKQTKQI